MKRLLVLIPILFLSILLSSCEKKNEGPTGPDIQFSLDPQVGRIYNFTEYVLDSLNRRTQEFHNFYEKCAAKNVSIGGVNDAFVSVTYSQGFIDTTYLRVVGGKDVYEYTDTTGFFANSARLQLNIKNALQKLTQNYVWLPRVLLSKGNNAEYEILSKRTYPLQVDSGVFVNFSFEMKGKNEGFEDLTVPAGTYKSYKVKIFINIEVYAYNQKIDSFEMVQYIWVNDDLDWWIKQYQPTVKSNLFGVIELGKETVLTSVQ
jgi:hypothetical protein